MRADFLAEHVLSSVFSNPDGFGVFAPKKELVLVESPSPNTNKPLHLGHVRNLLLGNAVENILRCYGLDVKRVDVVNDRGIHICKSMLAYQQFANNADPDKKSDHYVGDRYVKYAQEVKDDPDLDAEAQAMLRQRESGDPEVMALWSKMNKRALDGQAVTYKRYGTHIDQVNFESDHFDKGKSLVEQ